MRKFTIAGLGGLAVYLAFSFGAEKDWFMAGLMCIAAGVCWSMWKESKE